MNVLKRMAVAIAIITLGVLAIKYIADPLIRKQELNECHKWLKQSQEYVGWYSIDWQKEQCQAFNINLTK